MQITESALRSNIKPFASLPGLSGEETIDLIRGMIYELEMNGDAETKITVQTASDGGVIVINEWAPEGSAGDDPTACAYGADGTYCPL